MPYIGRSELQSYLRLEADPELGRQIIAIHSSTHPGNNNLLEFGVT